MRRNVHDRYEGQAVNQRRPNRIFAFRCGISPTSLLLSLSLSAEEKKKKTQTILLGVSIAPRSRCSVRSVRTAIAPMRRSLSLLVTPGCAAAVLGADSCACAPRRCTARSRRIGSSLWALRVGVLLLLLPLMMMMMLLLVMMLLVMLE